jgi:hypothetical protein
MDGLARGTEDTVNGKKNEEKHLPHFPQKGKGLRTEVIYERSHRTLLEAKFYWNSIGERGEK